MAILDADNFASLAASVRVPTNAYPNVALLASKFGIAEEAVRSIYATEAQRAAIRAHGRLQSAAVALSSAACAPGASADRPEGWAGASSAR